MAGYVETAEALRGLLQAQVVDPLGLPARWPNAPAEETEPGDFLELEIRYGESQPVGFGARRHWLRVGSIAAVLHTRVDQGEGHALEMADQVAAGLSQARFGSLVTDFAHLEPPSADGERYRVPITVPWNRRLGVPHTSPLGQEFEGTGFADAGQALRSAVSDAAGVPVEAGNVPTEGAANPRVLMDLAMGVGGQVDTGVPSSVYQPGLLLLAIETERGIGDQPGLEILDRIEDGLRAHRAGRVDIGSPSVVAQGAQGPRWVLDLQCPVRFTQPAA